MALKKYLERYAECETQRFTDFPYRFDHILVIPCHDEPVEAIFDLFQLPETNGATLVILVINQPDSPTKDSRDQQLWDALQSRYTGEWATQSGIVLYSLPDSNNSLLVVDRFSAGRQIPNEQGVGLARKIGSDIACKLIYDKKIANHWIHSTDADVRLPPDYFQPPSSHAGIAALIYPFQHHCPDKTLQLAIDLYEFRLRYYVAALQWAGSGYGFQTIGSLICIDADSYAKVRGFPKRAGAEDFYLLNKLAKVGKVHSLESPVVQVEARISKRVPFGTGPALESIQALDLPLEDYRFYHPKSFIDLASWHRLIEPLWHARKHYQQVGLYQTLESLLDTTTQHDCVNTEAKPPVSGQLERLYKTLNALKLETFLDHGFSHCSNQSTFKKQFHDWFDGFKTLRFIHLSRDHYFPDIRLQEITDNYARWFEEVSKDPAQSGFNLAQAAYLQQWFPRQTDF
ncbi:MAG: hypothetical protein KUG72_12100 [Pseudomonadales bacterium]|nr:hypothetical protein [Pseudomonadales bacterium]